MEVANGEGIAAGTALAQWAAGLQLDAIPGDVIGAAELHLADAVGVALAACALDEMPAAAAVVREQGGRAESTALGVRDLVPAASAALVNGTLAHALDFDDTHERGHVHASAVVGPAAFASGEAARASGGDVVLATVVGFEIATRIGIATGGRLQPRGFHPTSICGVFGAAAAAGRLRGLSAEMIANALGIAGSQAAGLFEFLADGSQTKPLHAGWAAHAGVIAAALAAHGATGPATVLEGRFGLLHSHLDAFEQDELMSGLGTRWETLNMVFKPYATCHCCHTPLDALAEILAAERLERASIERVVCRVPSIAVEMVLEPAARKLDPLTPYEAKFSLPFCIALLLVRGDVAVDRFTPHGIRDAEVLELARRVDYVVEEFPGGNQLSGGVQVHTSDGRTLAAEILHPRGSSANPLSEEAIREKFLTNARLALKGDGAEQLFERLMCLDEPGAVASLFNPATMVAV